jgi:sarcosine oxidase subunit gamma
VSVERRSLIARKLAGAPAAGRGAGVTLADRTLFPRAGSKGRGALAWLKAAGIELEATPNRSFRQPGGELAAVLAMTEALILSPGGDAALVERLEGACPPEGIDGCYPVPRRDSHFWFRLQGTDCARMFAKLCGVDLRAGAFPDGAIAQPRRGGLPPPRRQRRGGISLGLPRRRDGGVQRGGRRLSDVAIGASRAAPWIPAFAGMTKKWLIQSHNDRHPGESRDPWHHLCRTRSLVARADSSAHLTAARW